MPAPWLLASGKAVSISQLKVGDKVLAAGTKTGKDQPEAVTAVLVAALDRNKPTRSVLRATHHEHWVRRGQPPLSETKIQILPTS